ncbi:lipopolysaccharide biosynthesis protein [Tenacibaculum sp. Bg11-29]|uniref:glycosyltransferase family 4 protein n=1 Tax=Tenacibaculum sp. Bg11-29 TaxID=2058306 RepID=UPI000C320096|nr:glycosyltransferase family 4 protein [Tenacibaculum sp. Bg11-29]PKH49660.1 lipopolysaccharide biosynthesis protein [Tenacibaculum sp. Bg11-29]
MNTDLIVIHTHFHKRRTGVTRSIENVIPDLKKLCNTYIYGYGIEGDKLKKSGLKEILFSNKKVVVHCHRNNEIMKILWYRFLGAKFKLVSTRHAESDPSGLTRFLLRYSDEVVTLTKSMHEKLGIKNTKVSHGVNTEVFAPCEDVQLKDVSQKNIILCAGRVRKAKGQKIMLESLCEELRVCKNWAIVIVGKVDKPVFLDELKEIVKKNKVESQVYFIDETLNIISYYQAAKISIVPSYTEGFSLVCAEAMSCGNTVIATKNVGVHSEMISHGKNGYLFEAGNTENLKSLVLGMIKEESPKFEIEAREEIIQNWSVKKEAKELLAVYRGG